MNAQVQRDRWDRPLLPPPNGGKPIPYTRVSTLAKTLDESFNLGKWKQRMTALGVAARPDLLALAARLGAEDKDQLDELCEAAMQASGANDARDLGTALHAFTEAIDRGETVNPPPELAADLVAYRRVMAELSLESLEQELFVCNDLLQAAGTLDKLVRLPNGQVAVADQKSGRDAARYAHNAAIQIAIYAHSRRINLETGQRSPLHPDLNTDIGLLIHTPAKQGRASIHRLDLKQAWSWAQMCVEVRAWRKSKPAALALEVSAHDDEAQA